METRILRENPITMIANALLIQFQTWRGHFSRPSKDAKESKYTLGNLVKSRPRSVSLLCSQTNSKYYSRGKVARYTYMEIEIIIRSFSYSLIVYTRTK